MNSDTTKSADPRGQPKPGADQTVDRPTPAKTNESFRRRKVEIMNAMTRWNPFREMEDIHNRLFSLWNQTSSRPANSSESPTLSEWIPPVDISEDDNGYIIKAEVTPKQLVSFIDALG